MDGCNIPYPDIVFESLVSHWQKKSVIHLPQKNFCGVMTQNQLTSHGPERVLGYVKVLTMFEEQVRTGDNKHHLTNSKNKDREEVAGNSLIGIWRQSLIPLTWPLAHPPFC
jgi:hypothetical protein